jgi:hypothetical protein
MASSVRTKPDETTKFNGVKVFSATMASERDGLGDKITSWLRQNPHVKVVDTIVTQSSDAAFHCLAITIFYWEEPRAAKAAPGR